MTRLERIRAEMESEGLAALLLFDDKSIYYACGFMPTDSAAFISLCGGAWLITDSRYTEDAERSCAAGFEVLCSTADAPLLRQLGALYRTCAENAPLPLGVEAAKLSHQIYCTLESELGCKLAPADGLLTRLRASMDALELESIIAAQRIAEAAYEAVLPLIKPGVREYELAAELTYQMLRRGAERMSFDPIVLTGAHTSMPHGVPGAAEIKSGDFVTMDFGCVKNGYCSDMTRTVAVGYATDEMKSVYETVLRAQRAGIAAAKPTATGARVHGAGAQVIERAGFGKYFGHSFGHGVGLEIHEAPNASPRNEKPLGEGAVITAEPGIYLPGRFGVRIEDMLHIRGGGRRNLTRAPKELLIL